MEVMSRCFRYFTRRCFTSSAVLRSKKFAIPFPKGGATPPENPTVAYWPLPKHLNPEAWHYLQTPRPGKRILRYSNILMQNDARKRETVAYYGPLRMRLQCLKKNTYLPDELRTVAAEELARLPRDSCRNSTINTCIVTARPRGKRPRWRVSRMIFRKIADAGRMSGMERAFWDGASQGQPVNLEKQTRKKKH